jgi:hypothetical protein
VAHHGEEPDAGARFGGGLSRLTPASSARAAPLTATTLSP